MYILKNYGGKVDILYGLSYGCRTLMQVLEDNRLQITMTIADGMSLRDYPDIKSEALKELYLFFLTGTFFVVLEGAGKYSSAFSRRLWDARIRRPTGFFALRLAGRAGKTREWLKIYYDIVDTFYIYPTCNVDMAPEASQICEITDEGMGNMARGMYEEQATVFEESNNVFAPFYRQTNIKVLMGLDVYSFEEYQKQEQRTDIFAALDYYFENLNEGRPFILASHSQGSCMSKLVLGEYMQLHPEYLERMIAAYPIGFSFTEKWFQEHPYLSFAQGETDTGVIVSWNTEGLENKEQKSLVLEEGALAINPLNWRRDAAPATKSENPGSRLKNESTGTYELICHLADATVDPEKGTVLCNLGEDYYAPGAFSVRLATISWIMTCIMSVCKRT